MKRKLTEREMKTLFFVLLWFLSLSSFISLGIFLWCAFVDVTENVALEISVIYFSISFICFFKCAGFLDLSGGFLDFLHERNDKIDEEEKARQQALLLEAEERNRAELQIWVIE